MRALASGQPVLERALLATAALDLARLGAPVLPLRPRGKLPLTGHGCLDATVDALTIYRWWARWPSANVGMATGGGILVLDVDPRHGGDSSLANLPPLPPTRESLTGGGGRHLIFRGNARCSAGRLGPGLDVRGEGGYIVAPPSVHESGRPYQWREGRGLDFPVAEAPRWLLDALAERPRPPVERPRFTVPVELGRRIRRARAYVARVPGAVSGQGGHLATFRVALALVRGFELPEDVAFELLAVDFNPRCEPPWTERELSHKVASAARDARLESGYLLAEVSR